MYKCLCMQEYIHVYVMYMRLHVCMYMNYQHQRTWRSTLSTSLFKDIIICVGDESLYGQTGWMIQVTKIKVCDHLQYRLHAFSLLLLFKSIILQFTLQMYHHRIFIATTLVISCRIYLSFFYNQYVRYAHLDQYSR